MRTQLSKLALMVTFGLALTLTLSCSVDSDSGGNTSTTYCVVESMGICAIGLTGKQCKEGYKGHEGYSDTECPSGYDKLTVSGNGGGIAMPSSSSVAKSSSSRGGGSQGNYCLLDGDCFYLPQYEATAQDCIYAGGEPVNSCPVPSSSSSAVVSSSSLMPSSSSVGVSSSSGGGVSGTSGTFIDSRDGGRTYKWVKIGTQVWMAENLKYNASGSKCGNKGIILSDGVTCDTYGRLYDWATAMDIDAKYNSQLYGGSDVKHKGVCPTGWHIPSDAEWTALTNFVGSNAGTKLKATTGWHSAGNGQDTYGFAALPGGCGSSGGYFYDDGYRGYWWSATEYYFADYAYYWTMHYFNEGVYRHYDNKSNDLFSVRCLQD